jgi:5-methylcytosine-specific restriction endonuclease McrA
LSTLPYVEPPEKVTPPASFSPPRMPTPALSAPWHLGNRNLKRPAIRHLVARLRRNGHCGICGAPGPALQFHHLNPKVKAFTIGEAYHRTPTATRVEIGRTALVCDGCHKAIHAGGVDGSGLMPVPMPALEDFVPPEMIGGGR